MKRLALLRHAKAERDSASGRDFDRRLAERGRNAAARIGEEMLRLGLSFDRILTSPASRAAETAQLAGLDASEDRRIYDASAGELLAIVQAADDEAGSLLMVGHNPGFERLASLLSGRDIVMPTGALVVIALPAPRWADAGTSAGELVHFLRPKMLD